MNESNHNDMGMEKKEVGDDVIPWTKGEFVVHTKHSCDVCFQLILGKRYTASDRPNFDLCARCFDVYIEPGLQSS